ncbi:hypothetical protein WR25_15971 [Diploscapter pachys]|uniref:Ubiquitin-like domain-containing protein n=1 Tax=Diploscapter pachys TaxID=2018661 RepID=A0A2A2L2U5_9BILA|nr:hypothetical protein WR25_15971 [Diploscapter pachys]
MVADVYFEVQRHKTHLFVDLKDTQTIAEFKKVIEHILNIPADDMNLVRVDNYAPNLTQPFEDKKTMTECGFSPFNAMAQAPAVLGLIVKGDAGLQIEPLSKPPPVPDVMRNEQHAE